MAEMWVNPGFTNSKIYILKHSALQPLESAFQSGREAIWVLRQIEGRKQACHWGGKQKGSQDLILASGRRAQPQIILPLEFPQNLILRRDYTESGNLEKNKRRCSTVLKLWFWGFKRKKPEIRLAFWGETIDKTYTLDLDHGIEALTIESLIVFPNSTAHLQCEVGYTDMLMMASLSEINAWTVWVEPPFIIPCDMKMCQRFFPASQWHSSYNIYLFYGFEALSDTYQRPFHASTMHNIFCNSL